MAAAINGQVGVVRVLMDAHADPYAEHPEVKWGFTALVAAVDRCCSLHYGWPSRTIQQAQLAVVRCLLEQYHVCLKPPGLYDPSEPASDPVRPTLGSRDPANLPRDANAPAIPLSTPLAHLLRVILNACTYCLMAGGYDGHNPRAKPTSYAGAGVSSSRLWSSSKRHGR